MLFRSPAHGFAPGPYSNTMPIPTLQAPTNRSFENHPPPTNRLPPLPTLSIPSPQHNNPPVQMQGWPELLPPPAPATFPPTSRAMSAVYPPPVQWKPVFSTPTSTQPPPFPSTSTPTAGDRSRQVSPFPPGSANSSPTAQNYSNQRQLSPSHFLSQRQSPYRPVRSVTTLLVPPPPTLMHNPEAQVGFNQMQYHPLGRPMNERRVGTLPYINYGDQQHHGMMQQHQQYNQLPVPPQPNFYR